MGVRNRGTAALHTLAIGVTAGALLAVGALPAGAQPGGQAFIDVGYEPGWDPPATGEVTAWGFDEATPVGFELSASGTTTCLQQQTVSDGAATFDPWQDDPACNPEPGDLLTATGRVGGELVTKELVVEPARRLAGTVGVDADVATDVVTGVAPVGSVVEISTDDGSVEAAAPTGTFTLDLTGLVDVQPWTTFGVAVYDADGDVVRMRWRVSQPVVVVTPDSGLVAGQQVTVSGSGLTPGAVTLAQGHGFIGGIDESTYTEVTAAPDGTLSAPLVVRRVVHVPTGPEHDVYADVDCAAVDAATEGLCFVVAFDSGDSATYLDTAFRLPFVQVGLAPLAEVGRGGTVVVRGTLRCDPLDAAVLSGTLRQDVGRRTVTGEFRLTVPCTRTQWSASVRPAARGSFSPGLASVTAAGLVTAWDDEVRASASRVVLVLRVRSD